MAETYSDLVEQYESFLNDDVSVLPATTPMTTSRQAFPHNSASFSPSQRIQLADRISTAIDDFHAVKGAAAGCPRVSISMAELRSQGDGQLSRHMRFDPLRHLRALEAACHNVATEQRAGYDKDGTCVRASCEISVATELSLLTFVSRFAAKEPRSRSPSPDRSGPPLRVPDSSLRRVSGSSSASKASPPRYPPSSPRWCSRFTFAQRRSNTWLATM
jgi:hypothetical protein